MSSIKITSEYDIDRALVGIDPTQHPEAYRLLKTLKGIADVECDTGSIYEVAGKVVSNRIWDTKITQQAARIAQLEKSLAVAQHQCKELATEARLQRERAERHKARFYNVYYPSQR
jgi:hypothetical protein